MNCVLWSPNHNKAICYIKLLGSFSSRFLPSFWTYIKCVRNSWIVQLTHAQRALRLRVLESALFSHCNKLHSYMIMFFSACPQKYYNKDMWTTHNKKIQAFNPKHSVTSNIKIKFTKYIIIIFVKNMYVPKNMNANQKFF